MVTNENQPGLQQNRDVLMAALDYLLEHTTGRIKFDKVDPSVKYYQQQKEKAELAYQKNKPEKLIKLLEKIMATRRQMGDLNLSKYIKEKTGHTIDLFANLPQRVEAIIQQKKIKNNTQYQDVLAMTSLLHQNKADQEQLNMLDQLREDFDMRRNDQARLDKMGYSSKVLYDSRSPDNTCILHVHESGIGPDNSTTGVSVSVIRVGGGGIYVANGINLGIKAYWKDNNTIVVEEKKGTPVNTRWNQLQVFNHTIAVEYIETN